MITISNTGRQHGDGDNGCPGCRFRSKLATFLEASHREGTEEWHTAVGDLRRRMHEALLAIDGIESLPFNDDGPDMPFEDAADAITNVGVHMQELWSLLIDTGTPL
jgi:hypothetical protein